MSKQVRKFSDRLKWLLILFTVLLVQPAKAQDIPKSDHRLSDRKTFRSTELESFFEKINTIGVIPVNLRSLGYIRNRI